MPDPRDCGANVPGYVLGALERVEADGFQRHIDDCVVCRDEAAALQSVAAALAMASPQLRASKRLKRRVRSSLAAAPNLAMTIDHARSPRAWVPAASNGSPLARSALAAGGLLAAALVTVGTLAPQAHRTGGAYSAPAAVIDAGQFATAVVHVGQGHSELIVSHLAQPPQNKIYEVWLKRPGKAPRPTSSLFGVTASGAGVIDVPGNLSGVSEVLVTPEPLGGSRSPTHPPVIVAPLVS